MSTWIADTSGAATVFGALIMHGVTRPVVVEARFVGAGAESRGDEKMALGFAATTTIKRSEFRMGQGMAMVSDRVGLTINAGFDAR